MKFSSVKAKRRGDNASDFPTFIVLLAKCTKLIIVLKLHHDITITEYDMIIILAALCAKFQ